MVSPYLNVCFSMNTESVVTGELQMGFYSCISAVAGQSGKHNQNSLLPRFSYPVKTGCVSGRENSTQLQSLPSSSVGPFMYCIQVSLHHTE